MLQGANLPLPYRSGPLRRLAEARALLRAVIPDRPISSVSPSVGSASTQASASAATGPVPETCAVNLLSI
jgi:hypothetical protein